MVTMARRWLIRSFFMGLVVLCAGVWVWSCWCEIRLTYQGTDLHGFIIGGGRLIVAWQEGAVQPLGWNLTVASPTNWDSWDTYFANSHWHGFAYTNVKPSAKTTLRYCGLSIPIWFCTIFSTFLLGFFWWKTKLKTKQAFPIAPIADPKVDRG